MTIATGSGGHQRTHTDGLPHARRAAAPAVRATTWLRDEEAIAIGHVPESERPRSWKSWHRWTALCLLAYLYLAVAVAAQRQEDASSGLDAGLIPVTVPELLRLLRDTVIPPPRRDRAHRLHWSDWRRRHQHRACEVHRRWNSYAEATP